VTTACDRHGFAEQACFTCCYSPIRDETGAVVGMLDTVIETTGKVRAEQNTQLLNSELEHRLQNTLTLVTAIADQTFRTGSAKDAIHIALTQRIAALGHAHRLLTRTNWSGTSIRAIIESALARRRTSTQQISLAGPEVHLPTRLALLLVLAVNELATNALKYGALSTLSGHVTVRWEISSHSDEEGTFRLTWIEEDGPAVEEPTRRGFGSKLIEEIVASEFHGESRIVYGAQGVRWGLITQLDQLRE
jgi:two-component sensor histidine kinase